MGHDFAAHATTALETAPLIAQAARAMDKKMLFAALMLLVLLLPMYAGIARIRRLPRRRRDEDR